MRKLVITLFCVALLIPSRGNTLGLGEIELHSSLNQELNAEIALKSVGKESAETIIVKLASKAEFSRAGLDRPFILNDLKFVVKVKNGEPYISVTSKKTIREPFLSFLLDIDWPRGRILREFTMLLDPPVFMQATPEGIPSKVVVAEPQAANQVQDTNQQYNRPAYDGSAQTNNSITNTTAAQAPVVSNQAQAQSQQDFSQASNQQTTRPVARYQAATNGYRVQKNDTAWKIAEKLRSDPSVSIEQMMMALLRRNPEAFIKDNINGVKRGYILRMPDQQEIDNLGKQTALLQVREQYALWREYRQGLTAKRNANKIARGVKTDPKPDTSVKGQLTIASAADGAASDGATSGRQNPDAELKQLRQDLSATSEELESGKLENTDLKDRLKTLQARMKKMERLLNLKDGDLANLQSDIAPEKAEPAADTMAKEPVAEVSPATVDMKPEEMMAADSTSDTAAEMATEPETAMDAISSTQPADDAVFKDEMSSSMEPTETPVAPAPVIPPAQPVDIGEEDPIAFIEDLLKDPDNLPYIAGIPAAVLILFLLLAIRRKKAKPSSDDPITELPETGDFNFNEIDDIDLSGNDDAGFNAQEEEDLGAQLEAFAEEAEPNDVEDVISLDDDQPVDDDAPKDDVLAEADVYLAYGIYQQAEELLKTAITSNPDREEYKVKLLETYFAAKDKANFVSRAEEIQSELNPESPEWLRIIAMGREIDSTNEMFRNAGEIKGFDVDDLIPEKPETDFDLGNAAADFDLGESLDDADDFGHGLDDESLDDEIDATVALSADEVSDLGLGSSGDTDNFALNDDGMDELDLELAATSFDEPENLDLGGSEETAEDNVDDGFSLDFEMADLGLDETSAEISIEETEVVATAMEPEEVSFDLPDDAEESLDADLEMDLGDLSAELETEADNSSDDVSLDMGDIDLGGIDLSADDADDLSLDMSDDLSEDIGFDLGDDASADEDITVLHSTQEEEDESIDISTLPDDLDEVSTKLDLAKAYIDMGDSDGAASILREVIEEGAGAQKQEAEGLLTKIA